MLEGRTLGANITLEDARRVAEATIWNSVGMFQNNGYTAMRWLRDTRDLRALFEQLKLDITWFGDARYAPLEGGVLIRKGDGAIVGAIGLSGLPMDGLDD
ncbi:heme-binding protein, partial [Chloroflexota bacterium]